jgi:hypothetical protein
LAKILVEVRTCVVLGHACAWIVERIPSVYFEGVDLRWRMAWFVRMEFCVELHCTSRSFRCVASLRC